MTNKLDFKTEPSNPPQTPGEIIKFLRELRGWTQEELSQRSGVNTKNISLLENDRVRIGKKRAELLAKAFEVHPAVVMFPDLLFSLIDSI